MKNRTKMIALAISATAILFTTKVKAQTTDPNKFRLGIGLEAGAPTGNAHDFSNFELGGTARLQYGLSSNLALTLTSGYYNLFAKDQIINGVTVQPNSLGIVPLKAGIKAFFASNLYFGAEAGAAFETNSGGSTKLDLSPGLGFANKTWDVGVRYENFSGQGNSYGLVGLRIAYGFQL